MCKVPFEKMRNGTYGGVFNLDDSERKIVFRWEKIQPSRSDSHYFSADFFHNDHLVTSINGRIPADLGPCGEHAATQFEGDEPASKLRIVLHALDQETIAFSCVLASDTTPWTCDVAFEGSHFREMTLHFALMDSVPLPQPLKNEDFLPLEAVMLPKEPNFEMSLEHLFKRLGIRLNIHFTNLADHHFAFDTKVYRNCPERLLWDEKALHNLMLQQYPDTDDRADWTAYLLLLRGHYGTYGTYDVGGSDAAEKTVGLMFDRHSGWQMSSPGLERFFNAKPRQGAAIFWDPLIKKSGQKEPWYLEREYTFLLVHEIGHILNLRHAPDCSHLTYMNYPDFFCEGRDQFWQQFGFSFSESERIHLNHGYLPEVGPGQKIGFPLMSKTSAIGDTSSAQRFFLRMSKPIFAAQEPVGLELIYTNPKAIPIVTPAMDPAYGDVQISVTLPDGRETTYQPQVFKCLGERSMLGPGQDHRHVLILSLDQRGFWLDAPGHYSVTATIGPTSVDSSPQTAFTQFIREEPIFGKTDIHPIFKNLDAARFLSHAGIKSEEMKLSWENFVLENPNHPICGLARVALAFNDIPICHNQPQSKPYSQLSPSAKNHLAQAIEYGEFPLLKRRALIDIYDPPRGRPSHKRGFTARLRSWVRKFKRLFKKSGFLDFLGTHHLRLKFGKGTEAQSLNAILTVIADDTKTKTVTYTLQFPERPHHDHKGTGEFSPGNRHEDPVMILKGTSIDSAKEFELTMHFAVSIFAKKLFLTGQLKTGGGGGDGGTVVVGTIDPQRPQNPPGNTGS